MNINIPAEQVVSIVKLKDGPFVRQDTDGEHMHVTAVSSDLEELIPAKRRFRLGHLELSLLAAGVYEGGSKIAAIKIFRFLTDTTLKDAKDTIERAVEQHRQSVQAAAQQHHGSDSEPTLELGDILNHAMRHLDD
jgi:hypothetical protein